MANYVTTVCTVTGEEPSVAAFETRHIIYDGGPPFFDFRTLVPRPAVVEQTVPTQKAEVGLYALTGVLKVYCGTLTARFPLPVASRLYRFDNDHPARRWPHLPSWVSTRELLRAYLEAYDPEALEHGERARRCLEQTGHPDWYSWSIAHWGTRSNSYAYERRERAPGRFVFRFMSAYAFPEPVFRAAAKLYPELTLEVAAFEEAWLFGACGEFNGRDDFRCERELATPELYERVYGKPPVVPPAA